MADAVAIGLRALAYAAALLAAGAAIFVPLHRDLLARSLPAIRAGTWRAALLGLILTALHVLIEPVRLTGDWSGAIDPDMHAILLGTGFGATNALRLLGLAVILTASVRPHRSSGRLGAFGAALIAISFALTGHTAADAERGLLAPLLIVHVAAVAFWFGALTPLLTVSWREAPAITAAVIARFSLIAVWVVPLILIAGLAMAWRLLPGLSSLQTPYGISLTAKTAGFAILMMLAAMNKWRFGTRVATGDRSALGAFRTTVVIEWLLILAVVTLTAIMTSLFSPDHQ